MVGYPDYLSELVSTFGKILADNESWYLAVLAILMPILLFFVNKKVKSVWWKALLFALMMPVPTLWCLDDCGWVLWPMAMPGIHWFFGWYILPILAVYYLMYLAVFAVVRRWIAGRQGWLYLVGVGVAVALFFLGYFNYLLAQSWTKLSCGTFTCIEGRDYWKY